MTAFRNPAPPAATSRLPAILLVTGILVASILPGSAAAVTLKDYEAIPEVGLTQRIVIDRFSGVALSGYDPVSYFAGGRPLPGTQAHELVWAGAVWRFANEGNLAAFRAAPGVYAPAFGGYDGEAVGRGIAAAGNPRIFAVLGNKLVLFRDEVSRSTFLASREMPGKADRAWPALRADLAD